MTAYPIPSAALDDRLAFVGTAGSGKTYNAGAGVELLLERQARTIIVDPLGAWWGLRLWADGFTPSRWPVVIFGGAHGDLPLTEAAGALIGEAAATMAESCIIDLSTLGTKAAERRFMLAFLTALYRKTNSEPVHLIVDEADMFAPQKLLDKEGDAARLLGMMETIVRRGRIKGFVPWLITQRPAVLSKDVLSQADGLVAFKLTSSQDRAAIGAWIEGQADQQQGKAILASLPQMQRGQGVVWIPGRGILETAAFPKKVSFDSSRTPKRGETVRTALLQPLDVRALEKRLSAITADAKTNDPKALRARIAELERQAKQAPAALDMAAIEGARERGWSEGWAAGVRSAADAWAPLINAVRDASNTLAALPQPPRPPRGTPAPPVQPRAGNGDAAAMRMERPRAAAPDSLLPKGERACLIAMAMYRDGVTREQLTVLTGYKRSSRDAYIQRLREKGLCEQVMPDRLRATAHGVDALGDSYEPLPTGDALRSYWLGKLPEGERRVLEVLCEHFPGDVQRDEIDRLTGYKRSSRDAYLQRLAARQLIETAPGRAGAKAILFG